MINIIIDLIKIATGVTIGTIIGTYIMEYRIKKLIKKYIKQYEPLIIKMIGGTLNERKKED